MSNRKPSRHDRLNALALDIVHRVRKPYGPPTPLREELGAPIDIGVVLGTGWGASIVIEHPIPLTDLDPAFEALDDIPGHARTIGVATIAGQRVLVLSGRIHMYEGHRDLVYLLMRILWELDVRTLILTSASGGLRSYLHKGDIVVPNNVIANGPSPVDGPPFPVPHELIFQDVQRRIFMEAGPGTHMGTYVFNLGPRLEGPGDRRMLDIPEVQCVGMSTGPELDCIASFVAQAEGTDASALAGAMVVPLTCISNGLQDKHGHAANTAVMKAQGARLTQVLECAVRIANETVIFHV